MQEINLGMDVVPCFILMVMAVSEPSAYGLQPLTISHSPATSDTAIPGSIVS